MEYPGSGVSVLDILSVTLVGFAPGLSEDGVAVVAVVVDKPPVPELVGWIVSVTPLVLVIVTSVVASSVLLVVPPLE